MADSLDHRRPVHIRQRVESWLRLTEMSATRFGREAVGDPCLVFELRAGREPRAAMIRRIERFMNTQCCTQQGD